MQTLVQRCRASSIVAASGARGCASTASGSAREKRRAFRDETYWARPVPGFGDPRARAAASSGWRPAAHGANRTGRVFTGDGVGGSGDFLMAALHRAGLREHPDVAAIRTMGWS